jgi:hypothetical protein
VEIDDDAIMNCSYESFVEVVNKSLIQYKIPFEATRLHVTIHTCIHIGLHIHIDHIWLGL